LKHFKSILCTFTRSSNAILHLLYKIFNTKIYHHKLQFGFKFLRFLGMLWAMQIRADSPISCYQTSLSVFLIRSEWPYKLWRSYCS
jgi:hypothetical protein